VTPLEFVADRFLSRPLTMHDLKVVRGGSVATGAFSRVVTVAGTPVVVLDVDRVRADWSTGRFAIRCPADLADAVVTATSGPTALEQCGISDEVVALTPSARLTDSIPRGADAHVDTLLGTLSRVATRADLDLVAGESGAIVLVRWRQVLG
jgi:hypothetical protein